MVAEKKAESPADNATAVKNIWKAVSERGALLFFRSTIPPTATRARLLVVFDTEDTKKAKEFAVSADLKDAMMRAGVVDSRK